MIYSYECYDILATRLEQVQYVPDEVQVSVHAKQLIRAVITWS